jgi:hypothetical protein
VVTLEICITEIPGLNLENPDLGFGFLQFLPNECQSEYDKRAKCLPLSDSYLRDHGHVTHLIRSYAISTASLLTQQSIGHTHNTIH